MEESTVVLDSKVDCSAVVDSLDISASLVVSCTLEETA